MISILKNYVRGPIIDSATEYYKRAWGRILKRAETHHLLIEVLKDFESCIYGKYNKIWRKELEGSEEHYIILNALEYAMRCWDL